MSRQNEGCQSVSQSGRTRRHHGAIETHRTQSRRHRPRLHAGTGQARRHRDQGPDREMNRAKMPQLESPLPEGISPKKISARRTHVALCRPLAAPMPWSVAGCRRSVAVCHNIDRRRICRLGRTRRAQTGADRPVKNCPYQKFRRPGSQPKKINFSAATRPGYPPPRSFHPFSPGYRFIPQRPTRPQPRPQSHHPQPRPTQYRSSSHDRHDSHHRQRTHTL